MKIKKIWATYFSPTGTTKKIANRIAQELSRVTRLGKNEFDFTLPQFRRAVQCYTIEDIVVFGMPVYAGRVPNVLLKYLNTLKGNGAYVVPVVVFGNRDYDDALNELQIILNARGFHVIAAAAFIGEHSFSEILGKGRPDAADLTLAATFADKIAYKLSNSNTEGLFFARDISEKLCGYYQPQDENGNPFDIRKVRPKTKESCLSCGWCAQVCPMGSIDPECVREFTGICIKCGACIKKCPQGARYYDDESYIFHKLELEKKYSRRAEPSLFV